MENVLNIILNSILVLASLAIIFSVCVIAWRYSKNNSQFSTNSNDSRVPASSEH